MSFYDEFLYQHDVDLCAKDVVSKVKDMLLLCDNTGSDKQSYET